MSTATMTTAQPHEAGKQRGVFKKMLKYLQDQAVENSNPRTYLTPPGLEPHQKFTHLNSKSQYDQQRLIRRTFSDATTAVETKQYLRRPEAMAGHGADAGVFRDVVSTPSSEMKKVQYAQDNILQNYRLYVPERTANNVQGDQYWIMYIHGGYFRDPKVDAASFRPALAILTAEKTLSNQSDSLSTVPESAEASPASSREHLTEESNFFRRHVAGYASINYRLAPHPGYPQDEDTEDYVLRNAKFPDQLHDVHAAIRHLQTRYDIGSNYILAGHSVGATLAFLAAMKAAEGQIDPPACIVGLNGIYDFPRIHIAHPDYEAMTTNTMRRDQYQEASPALYKQSSFLDILSKQTSSILLSHSKDDGLVDWEQLEAMQDTLLSDEDPTRLRVEMIETKGQHDSIWKDGKELARTLIEALQMVTAY